MMIFSWTRNRLIANDWLRTSANSIALGVFLILLGFAIALPNLRAELYRIRVGDYRIIYSIDNTVLIITVVKIGHRKEIYK
ncbi:MAG: type II toxin-antitoxin system RelE/ParE family toxin [Methylococcales bacterium]|nr:type II toxin-antitoxin system RelE/ParE family toxin [Methylococcales bacterium]